MGDVKQYGRFVNSVLSVVFLWWQCFFYLWCRL